MSTADDLAAAYVAWRDMSERHNQRPSDDWRHEGKRAVPEELDRQAERNRIVWALGEAERAYRAEVGRVLR